MLDTCQRVTVRSAIDVGHEGAVKAREGQIPRWMPLPVRAEGALEDRSVPLQRRGPKNRFCEEPWRAVSH